MDVTNANHSAYYDVPLRKTTEERTITEFPLPYDYDCSPHRETNFSYRIQSACDKIKNIKCSKRLSTHLENQIRLTKVIVVGDVAVGKTCLVRRFCLQSFETNYKATIGVDFEAEKFFILGIPYILQLWDTAGQEKFKCIASSYYRNARVVILVFDFSQLASLYNIPKWLDETLKCTDTPLLFLVGTKKDSVTSSACKLTEKEAIKLANTIHAEYCPVSAKTGENVEKLFKRIAVLTFCESILKESSELEEVKISEDFVKISKTTAKKKKGKCFSSCSS